MDLEMIILSEVCQTEKDKLHNDITYMWDLKTNEQRVIDTENKQVVARV